MSCARQRTCPTTSKVWPAGVWANRKPPAALFDRVRDPSNEDSFKYPLFMMYAERAGALLEAGKAAEAADMLVLLVEENPDVHHITAALKAFTVAGKSLDALVAAMPADRLDKVAAALTLVPPAVADQMADALWARFGPRPQLLAASIRFAPQLDAPRALEWSARLRSIGMLGSCPLLARAAADDVAPAERVRASGHRPRCFRRPERGRARPHRRCGRPPRGTRSRPVGGRRARPPACA